MVRSVKFKKWLNDVFASVFVFVLNKKNQQHAQYTRFKQKVQLKGEKPMYRTYQKNERKECMDKKKQTRKKSTKLDKPAK